MSQKNNNNDDDDDDYDEEEYNDLISQMQLLLIGRNQKKKRKDDDDEVSNTNNRNEREDEGRELTREEELALLEKYEKNWYKKEGNAFGEFVGKKENKDVKKLSIIGNTFTPRRNKTLAFRPLDGQFIYLYDEDERRLELCFDSQIERDHSIAYMGENEVMFFGGTVEICYIVNVITGKIRQVGKLNLKRTDAAGVLLNNGNLLIVGGKFSNNLIRTCELFLRSEKKFVTTGGLFVGRRVCTATLLGDKEGSVIVIGGIIDGNIADSSEIYNPSIGTFKQGPQMINKRAYHTATLLNNGKVFVCGGDVFNSDRNLRHRTTEFYDPINNKFIEGPIMPYTIVAHVAILLSDGKVLLCGGEVGSGDIHFGNPAMIYDPKTNSFYLVNFSGSI